ncbi:MAG: nucleoside deaminase [Bdellovibrionales bacterium]|nr:nucleoside deaminase [Bdellovibrionales bacterium]
MSLNEKWMRLALEMAKQGEAIGEVPVGAVIVCEGELVAKAHNLRESCLNPTYHAEVLAIQEASQKLGRWRLTGCELYVSLEPCVMCSGAIVQSRLDRVIYGARDPKAGAVESLYQILSDSRLNHRPLISGGILEEECSHILKTFFRRKRLADFR